MNPTLSILLGTFNRIDSLKLLIDSLYSKAGVDFEVLIADAGSSDGTLEWLRSLDREELRIFEQQKKIGQARALNELLPFARGRFVCWLSDDNELVSNELKEACMWLSRDNHLGIYGLKVKDVVGPFSNSPYIGGISTKGLLNVNQGVLRTDTMRNVNGFSVEYGSYGIDPDLVMKVILQGLDVVYSKQIALIHYRDWGMQDSQLMSEIRRANATAQKLYLEKYQYIEFQSRNSKFKKFIGVILNFVSPVDKPRLRPSTVKYISTRGIHRTLRNIIHSSLISIYDPILHFMKPFHLRQYSPRSTLGRRSR